MNDSHTDGKLNDKFWLIPRGLTSRGLASRSRKPLKYLDFSKLIPIFAPEIKKKGL